MFLFRKSDSVSNYSALLMPSAVTCFLGAASKAGNMCVHPPPILQMADGSVLNGLWALVKSTGPETRGRDA